jgi:ParB/RepB/Spo0J family partition protein
MKPLPKTPLNDKKFPDFICHLGAFWAMASLDAEITMKDEMRLILSDRLVEPWITLREVNKESVEYLELRDSIAAHGFFNSICVRPAKQRGFYEVVDGRHRWKVSKDLRLTEVPCVIKHNLTDDDVLSFQIQANAIRPETTPMEYARQLKKIVKARPNITLAQLQAIVHKHPTWINRLLGLLDLTPRNQKRVARGEMTLDNATRLAQIPYKHQSRFVDLAMTMPTAEFKALISAYLKRYKEAARQGTLDLAELNEYVPVPYCRPVKELQRELDVSNVGAVMTVDCSSLDAWKRCLQWVLHLDEESLARHKEKFIVQTKTAIIERKEPDDVNCPFLPDYLDPLTPTSKNEVH